MTRLEVTTASGAVYHYTAPDGDAPPWAAGAIERVGDSPQDEAFRSMHGPGLRPVWCDLPVVGERWRLRWGPTWRVTATVEKVEEIPGVEPEAGDEGGEGR